MLSALLNILARLLCHGKLLSLVLGLEFEVGICGLLAVCALPCAILAERSELWRDVDAVLLLLRRRSRASMSGVGVVLRDELRECEPSLPL